MQIDKRLIEEIEKGLSNGYSIHSIKHSLISEGYNINLVEESIRSVEYSIKENAINYIKENKKYPLSIIKQSLINNYYPYHIVSEAIKEVKESRERHEHKVPYLILFFGLLLTLGVLLFIGKPIFEFGPTGFVVSNVTLNATNYAPDGVLGGNVTISIKPNDVIPLNTTLNVTIDQGLGRKNISSMPLRQFILNSTGKVCINLSKGVYVDVDVNAPDRGWEGLFGYGYAINSSTKCDGNYTVNLSEFFPKGVLAPSTPGTYNISVNATYNITGEEVTFSLQKFTVTEITAPYWRENKTNVSSSTRINDNGAFSINYTDNYGVDTVIFSARNSTQEWYNLSQQRANGVININVTFNFTIRSPQGTIFQWKFYANDTSGNWNETSIHSITIADTSPVWTTTIPDDLDMTEDVTQNHVDINGYCTDADSDPITYNVQTEDTTKVDVTLTGTQLSHDPADNWNGTTSATIRCTANSVTTDDTYSITVAAVQDYMVWIYNATNTTTVRVNDNVMFTVNVTDNDTIATCLFALKNSTGADWYNYSALNVNVISYNATYNLTVSSNATQTLSWRFFCNDTEGVMYNSTLNNIVIADTAATFTQVGINASTVYQNDNVMFNATVTDPDQLAMYIFSIKNGTAGTWYNYSAQSISPKGRTNYFINTSHSISTAASDTQFWRYYVNDSNVMYDTSEQSFSVTSADNQPPYFSFNRTNFTSIRVNENGQFNITVTDAVSNLDTVIFAIKNDTAAWENRTTFRTSSSSINLAFNLTISLTYGKVQYWKFYANDSNGLMNESALHQIVISDSLPDILSVYMSDNNNLATYTNCSGNTGDCAFNPVSGTNITLAVNITTNDVDNDCDSAGYGKTILYLCLNSTALAGCGDNTNANFTIPVEAVSRRGSVCEWKFNNNLTNITPQFFIANGNYLYYINATSQANIRANNDIEANSTWVYGSLKSVNFPGSLTLGDESIDLGQWNPGTNVYNMTNYGNVIVTGIRWNSTDPSRAGALKNWTLLGWDFLLDDDTSVSLETSGKIYPLNITNTTAQYFNFSTGLELCISKECNADSLNESMPTYWHIYPPTGLSPGVYTNIINYFID